MRGIAARVPVAALVCAAVAFLNAAAWSVVVPAFQVPDEQSHYAYTEYLVQHGQPPISEPEDRYSSSEDNALAGLRFNNVRHRSETGTIWSAAEQARLTSSLEQQASRSDGNGAAREVGGEPPLFYALQAIPYQLADSGTVLDRLQLMRLLSALIAGVTVLFMFLFLREALPGNRETWTVGALGVAFLPMFGFMSGGMNSDALLYAASAALFYLLARGFRRGLTPWLAVAIGAALATGLMTKFNAMGLVPGTAIAVLAMAVRQDGRLRLATLRLPTLTIAVAVAPVLLEAMLNTTVWDRPAFGATASNYRTSALDPTVGSALSYLWQFYLVPLPGMTQELTSGPFYDLWFKGFVGWFGWVDTSFPSLVRALALIPIAAIAVLAGRTTVVQRADVRERKTELLSYGVLIVLFMGFVAVASYIQHLRYGGSVAQIRYLFTLLPVYAAVLALAARGAGRRWAPVLGTAIVMLAIAHTVFAQLLVVSRYYA